MSGSDGGVPGVGGATGSAADLLSGLTSVPTICKLFGITGCSKDNKHWLRVELRYKDTREFVTAAHCRVLQGKSVTDSGPLGNGVLESKGLEAGVYTVTFPDIDASEWTEG